MNIAVISNMDTGMMKAIEKIKEQAMSMKIGVREITPVNRIIDIPMAVRRLGERVDIDSIILAVDFPEMRMEHTKPLFERIREEVSTISAELKKPVSMDLIDLTGREISEEKVKTVLEHLIEKNKAGK